MSNVENTQFSHCYICYAILNSLQTTYDGNSFGFKVDASSFRWLWIFNAICTLPRGKPFHASECTLHETNFHISIDIRFGLVRFVYVYQRLWFRAHLSIVPSFWIIWIIYFISAIFDTSSSHFELCIIYVCQYFIMTANNDLTALAKCKCIRKKQ